MKKLLDYLGACHSPNSVRGYEVTDRKQVWIGDYCYNYSLNSDSEAVAKDAVEKHLINCVDANSPECILIVREQLGLKELRIIPLEISPKQPVTKKNITKKNRKK